MNMKTVKKLLGLLLSVMILLNGKMDVYAYQHIRFDNLPLNDIEQMDKVVYRNGKEILLQEDFVIDSAVAREIAKLFIDDCRSSNLLRWNKETDILSMIEMYNINDTGTLSGYLFKLTEGYVVISANLLAPSLIIEWSDEGEPLTEKLGLNADDKVLYGGGIHYYKQSENDAKVKSVDQIDVYPFEVIDALTDNYSINNVSNEVLSAVRADVAANRNPDVSSTMNVYGEITSAELHAKTYYGNSMQFSGEYCNRWDSCVKRVCVTSYSSYANCCGPVAITNLIRLIGNRRGYNNIVNSSAQSVLDNTINTGIANYYYNIYGGTNFAYAKPYLIKAFQNYGVSINVTGSKLMSYSNIVDTLSYRDNLMMIMMLWHPYYKYHHVAGYAYTRFSNNLYDKIYVKILDGWSTSPRYLLLDTVSGDAYIDVSYD